MIELAIVILILIVFPLAIGKKEDERMTGYAYGMRLRGFSIGCQPSGVIERQDDESGKYWDVIIYDHELTPEEQYHYSLDYLGEREI